MVPECFGWIPHLLCSLLSSVASKFKKSFDPFPDDILVNILSRLSADDVKLCRIVCSHWRELTSSTHFVELQSKRAPNVILVQCYDRYKRSDSDIEPNFYVLDKITETLRRVDLKSGGFFWRDKPQLFLSCSGLLLFQTQFYTDHFFNPVTHEQRTILFHQNHFNVTEEERNIPQFGSDDFAGIYFNPLASEYQILFINTISNYHGYYIYNYASRVRREIATSPSIVRPLKRSSPAILNHGLHYIVDQCSIKVSGIDPCMHAVMVIQMDSEHISTFPHPRIICDFGSIHRQINLFVKDDEYLSLCHLSDMHGNIDIWILEDYANRFWVKQYKITLGVARNLNFNNSFRASGCYVYEINVMSVRKDELLIDWKKHGLFLYNLTKTSVKQIDVPLKEENHIYCPVVYTGSLATPSLY